MGTYTFSSTSHQTYIDYFFLKQSDLPHVQRTNIDTCTLLNLVVVVLEISLSNNPFRTWQWRFKLSLIQYVEIQATVAAEHSTFFRLNLTTVATPMEPHKCYIREIPISRGFKRKKQRSELLATLVSQIRSLEQTDKCSQAQATFAELQALRERLKILLSSKVKVQFVKFKPCLYDMENKLGKLLARALRETRFRYMYLILTRAMVDPFTSLRRKQID